MCSAGLSLGHIPYLNCVPFFHFLKQMGFQGELISGVPAELNRLLQSGQLDVSPSSSFEYARNHQDYLLLPGHSISSFGKVQSVLLFSPVELAGLEGQQIAITGESATSINLLRVILREFYALKNVSDSVPALPVEEVIASGQPALLIGDRALRLAASLPAGMRIYDLGEIWQQQTGLPFVFALWMVRRNALQQHSQALSRLSDQLHRSCARVLNAPDRLAATLAPAAGLTAQQIIHYWKSIDYRLDAVHVEGLRLFFDLCEKHKLLSVSPPLDFLAVNHQEGAISG